MSENIDFLKVVIEQNAKLLELSIQSINLLQKFVSKDRVTVDSNEEETFSMDGNETEMGEEMVFVDLEELVSEDADDDN